MSLAMLGALQPAEKAQALLSVGEQLWGSPTRAKGQYRAIREGFLEAEEAELTWKGDDSGT